MDNIVPVDMYKEKYLKYKAKYIELKNSMIGSGQGFCTICKKKTNFCKQNPTSTECKNIGLCSAFIGKTTTCGRGSCGHHVSQHN